MEPHFRKPLPWTIDATIVRMNAACKPWRDQYLGETVLTMDYKMFQCQQWGLSEVVCRTTKKCQRLVVLNWFTCNNQIIETCKTLTIWLQTIKILTNLWNHKLTMHLTCKVIWLSKALMNVKMYKVWLGKGTKEIRLHMLCLILISFSDKKRTLEQVRCLMCLALTTSSNVKTFLKCIFNSNINTMIKSSFRPKWIKGETVRL